MPRVPARPAAAALAAAAVLALAACSQTASPAASTGTGPQRAHAHGIYASPDASKVLVATHDGLYDCSGARPARIGPAADLMGFTGDGAALYASGHPGPGSSLPDPAGLLRSADGGATWQTLSLQGEADFHALTLTRGGAVGFDGRLRTTGDLRSWADARTQIQAFALAGRPGTAVVLATAQDGLRRSADSGQTWNTVPGAPLIQFAALASATRAAGISPDGTVYTSADAGLAWAAAGRVTGEPEAMTATEAGGTLRIWAVTSTGVLLSRDGGKAFAPYQGKGSAR